jgi:hypothetical protein
MHASSETQVVLDADVRINCGVVCVRFRGGYDECEHAGEHAGKYSVKYYRTAEPYGRFVA